MRTQIQKLIAAQGEAPDPDAGRKLKKSVRAELLRLDKEVRKGKRGTPLKDVVKGLGLD